MNRPLQISIDEYVLPEDKLTPWLGPLAPWMRKALPTGDERSRRWFAICAVVSLLLHLLLFLIPASQIKQWQESASVQKSEPLTITLANPVPRTPPPTSVKEPVVPHREPVIATRHPSSPHKPAFTVPLQPAKPTPAPSMAQSQPQSQAQPEQDMTSILNEKRAARQAVEDAAARENAAAAAANREPSIDDKINANLNRNKKWASRGDGTSGVFYVKSVGVREGELIFNGWHPGAGDHWHESYTVDAGEGGNVRLAIIKKMIEIIRQSYSGDFSWELRSGRAVTMSARPADDAQLRAFLMKQMFGEES